MLEIARLGHGSDRFELGFVERESNPRGVAGAPRRLPAGPTVPPG
jgi:hypothetical protein